MGSVCRQEYMGPTFFLCIELLVRPGFMQKGIIPPFIPASQDFIGFMREILKFHSPRRGEETVACTNYKKNRHGVYLNPLRTVETAQQQCKVK